MSIYNLEFKKPKSVLCYQQIGISAPTLCWVAPGYSFCKRESQKQI